MLIHHTTTYNVIRCGKALREGEGREGEGRERRGKEDLALKAGLDWSREDGMDFEFTYLLGACYLRGYADGMGMEMEMGGKMEAEETETETEMRRESKLDG